MLRNVQILTGKDGKKLCVGKVSSELCQDRLVGLEIRM